MLLPRVNYNPDTLIDFYAGNDRSYKELVPIYNALGERRGVFFASPFVHENGTKVTRLDETIAGDTPIVVSSYKDLNDIFISSDNRPFIMYEREHNIETRGLLNVVSLFLCREMRTFEFRKTFTNQDVYLFGDENHAARIILDYCKGKEVKYITEIDGKSVGIIYMAWGDKATKAIQKSLASLHYLGYSYPVAVIGDMYREERLSNKVENIYCNTNPFDLSKVHNFQFRAGRVKPLICNLSPFDLNLYIDADTYFIQPIQSTFEMLLDYDLLVTEEKLTLADLYNKKLAGWELNMLERDTTIIELDNDSEQKFINSGVVFFRKNKKTIKLFSDWQKEWLRFQEWDEQLAFMRAMNNNRDVKINRLSVDYNSPHLTQSSIIFHNYGRGDVRQNV